jgi:hypothetical protein
MKLTLGPMTLADRLHACHSSVVHDVMKDLGLPLRVLPRTIVGLERTMKAAGPVFTIRGRPDPTLDKHTSLYEWAGLLSRAPAGHVVVCQPQDDTRALFGGLSAEALQCKGVRGYIVDGGCRDVQAVADQGFPVFARFATPIDIVCAWRAEAFGSRWPSAACKCCPTTTCWPTATASCSSARPTSRRCWRRPSTRWRPKATWCAPSAPARTRRRPT